MNDDPRYSSGTVVAGAVWLTTALMLVIAWAVWVLGGDRHIFTALLVAETACVLSAVAAVLQLRCYAARICQVVRLNGGQPHDAEVKEWGPRG